ncbi:amidase family protein [Paenibacillus sp. MMS20-IR301]|uniref:amidase family protein n=1 Tax=Paenibacillus sp. MMS20-IR301 TaxID=2895946 RepID=UPI0028E396EF|nr:amidase family protein [Paenibacillus sp. MMS20-IR301]WNS40892.1 amidase family protein [Paenibacillus sp. MMS20-IR301]
MEALQNQYGAFIAPELRVPACGRGTLDGLSFAVKDVFAVAGHRSSAGNPDWLRSHEPAAVHAAAVHKLLSAGASLRGAAHTDELMYSLGGENYHYGTPVNPQGAGRIPGGSSSGSAVAVASGSVDFALGTDTGGSIRVPAAYCGVYGFRPTHGAVEMDGVIPLAPGFDTAGWIAGSAERLLRVGKVLLGNTAAIAGGSSGPGDYSGEQGHAGGNSSGTGQDLCDPKSGISRMYIPAECWALVEQDCAAYLERGVERLQAGASLQVIETEIAPEGLKTWMDVFRELQGAEIWATHGTWIERERPVFGPDIAARFSWAAGLAGADHGRAGSMRRELAERLRSLLRNDGCLVIPTVPGPAPRRGGEPAQLERNRSGAMMLCCLAGLAGLPQITLPVAGPEGLPLGLSVIGGHEQDLSLLSWVQAVWE